MKNAANQRWEAFLRTRMIEQLARRTGMTPLQFWRTRHAWRITGKNLATGEESAPLRFDTPVDVLGGVDALRSLSSAVLSAPAEGEAPAVTALRAALDALPEEMQDFARRFFEAFGEEMAKPESAQYAGALNLLQAVWRGLPEEFRNSIEAALPEEVRTALGEQRASYRGTHGAEPVYTQQEDAAVRAEEQQRMKEVSAVKKLYGDTGLWLKAPNGKASNLTAEQWVIARTPSFKAKYGDRETLALITQHKEWVVSGEPVAELRGDELPKSGGHTIDQAAKIFESQGGVAVSPVLGKIELNTKGIKASIHHGMNRAKIAAFTAVKDVIEKGRVVNLSLNWKGRGYDTAVICAPIEIAGKRYVCEVVARRLSDGRKDFYLHQVDISENVAATIWNPSPGVEQPRPAGTVNLIIAKDYADLNGKISVGLDENGEPLAEAISEFAEQQGISPEVMNQEVSTALAGKRSIDKGLALPPEFARAYVDVGQALQNETWRKAAVKSLRKIPGVRALLKTNAPFGKKIEGVIDYMAETLLWLYNKVPEDVRARSRRWYVGAHNTAAAWAGRYGIRLRQAAAIMAVFSPKTNWYLNMSMAERTLDIYFGAANFAPDEAMKAKIAELAANLLGDTGSALAARISRIQRSTLRDLLGAVVPAPTDDKKARKAQNDKNKPTLEDAAIWIRAYDSVKNSRDVYVINPEGGIARDANGNPTVFSLAPSVLKEKTAGGEKVPVVKRNKDGSAVLERDRDGNLIPEYSEDGTPVVDRVAKKDDKGNEVRDANGNTVYEEKVRYRVAYEMVPGKAFSFSFGPLGPIIKALKILQQDDMNTIFEELGTEFKVRDFYNNIYNPWNDRAATIDTHAVGAATMTVVSGNTDYVGENFGARVPEPIYGQTGTFPIFFEAYRRAAEKAGCSPREMQSITWEAIRAILIDREKAGLRPRVNAIWAKFEAGEITAEEARERIFKIAGGLRKTAWEDSAWNEEIGDTYDRSQVKLPPPRQIEPDAQLAMDAAPAFMDLELAAKWRFLTDGEKQAVMSEVLPWLTSQVAAATKTFISDLKFVRTAGPGGRPQYKMYCGIADRGDFVRVGKLLASYLQVRAVSAISPHGGGALQARKVFRIEFPEYWTAAQKDYLYSHWLAPLTAAGAGGAAVRVVSDHFTQGSTMLFHVDPAHEAVVRAQLDKAAAADGVELKAFVEDAFAGDIGLLTAQEIANEEKAKSGSSLGDDAGGNRGVRAQARPIGYDADIRRECEKRFRAAVDARLRERGGRAAVGRWANPGADISDKIRSLFRSDAAAVGRHDFRPGEIARLGSREGKSSAGRLAALAARSLGGSYRPQPDGNGPRVAGANRGHIVWRPDDTLRGIYEANGVAAPDLVELSHSAKDAKRFRDAIAQTRDAGKNKFFASVYLYSVKDYRKMKLFMDADGKCGIAVKANGDIVSVFKLADCKHKQVVHALIEVAKAAGGNHLDCYDTVLPGLYAAHGFRATVRQRWNDDFTPEGWKKETYKGYGPKGHGDPDVVYMSLDPYYFGFYDPFSGDVIEDYGETQKLHGKALKWIQSAAQARLDDEYAAAVAAGDTAAAQQMLLSKAVRLGYSLTIPADTPTYRLRTGNLPKKTIRCFKAFYVDPETGEPSALFASGSTPIPTGVWIDAKEMWHFKGANGRLYIPVEGNKNGKGEKKGGGSAVPAPTDKASLDYLVARGFLTQEKADRALRGEKVTLLGLAYRPGWHAGLNPFFPQGGARLVDASGDPYEINGYPNAHEANKVIFEIEVNADHDLTEKAKGRAGRTKKGEIKQGEACFDSLSEDGCYDGFYFYTTNKVAASTLAEFDGAWVISDSIRIVRALTEDEVNALLDAKGIPHQPWIEPRGPEKNGKLPPPVVGKLRLEDLNVKAGPVSDAARKTSAITYDAQGRLIPLSQRFDAKSSDVLYQMGAAVAGEQGLAARPADLDRLEQTRKPDNAVVPVVSIPAGLAPSSRKLRTIGPWIRRVLGTGGDVTIRATGQTVKFTVAGIASSQKRLRDTDFADSYPVLREMIENAEFSEFVPVDERHKDQGLAGQYVYHSALLIDGRLYSVRISLDVLRDELKERYGQTWDTAYKGHQLIRIEIAPASNEGMPGEAGGPLQGGAISQVTLGVLRGSVKPSRIADGIVEQVAYHGSPYIFDKFTLDHIGEGEGGHAHGFGLYFALNRKTAERYHKGVVEQLKKMRQKVEETDRLFVGKKSLLDFIEDAAGQAGGGHHRSELYDYLLDRLWEEESPSVEHMARQVEDAFDFAQEEMAGLVAFFEDEARMYEADGDSAHAANSRSEAERARKDAAAYEVARAKFREALAAGEVVRAEDAVLDDVGPGRLYEVDIPEDHEMLREEASFTDQPKSVRDGLSAVYDELGLDVLGGYGRSIYNEVLAAVGGNWRKASELFARHGILGMRYNGRRDGECAVVWTEEAVQIREILEQQQGPGAGKSEAAPAAPDPAPGPRGYFNTKSFTTTLTTSADLSTFAHETGHWYLETIMSLVRDGYGDESLKGDVKVLCETFGIQSAEEFFQMAPEKKRIVHERFAAWVEEYLGTGKAPDESLKAMFQRFADWIIGVYQDVFLHNALSRRHEALFGEKLPELSDEVRGVLDRMVGAQRQQEQFESTFGAEPLFGEKPDWVSEEEWEDYAQAQAARTQEGRETLMSRNLATMKWAKRAHSRVLRWMQKEADAKRAAIRDPRSARP